MQDSKHNPEGYLDLTAYEAMEEIPQAGEIWTYERKPGKLVEVLIVRNHGNVATSLILINACYSDCVPVRIGRSNTRRYTNPQMLGFVLTKNLHECVARLPDAEFEALCGTVQKTIFSDRRKGGRTGMTKQEFAKFAMALRTYYPKEQLLPNTQAMELWYQELEDIPFEVAQVTLRKWVSTNKWSPSIAEIRELAATVTGGDLPDWGEGWAQVQRAFGRFGRDRKAEALASFDPITRKAVEYLGWRELCNSENPMQDRANFRQCFEAVAKREQLDRQTALPLQQAAAAIRIDFSENGRLRIGAGGGCHE